MHCIFMGIVHAHSGEADDNLQRVASVIFKLEPADWLAASYLREIMFNIKTMPEAFVCLFAKVVIAVTMDGFAELDAVKQLVRTTPSTGDAPAAQFIFIFTADVALRPERLAVVIVYAMLQVEDNLLSLALGEDVAMHATVGRGCQLTTDAVIVKQDSVVSRLSMFCFVAETLTVATIGIGGGTWIELRLAGVRHDEDVAEVAMPSTAEMSVTESNNAAVAVLVTGTIVVGTWLIHTIDIVRNGVRIGTQLHETVWIARPWEGVSHAIGTNKRIDILVLPHSHRSSHAKNRQY